MAEFTNVVIGIQARSTSERFPNKVHETIGNVPMIKHVLNACKSSSSYMNRVKHMTKQVCQVALLIPDGDEIGRRYKKDAVLIEGPEHDVLTRYATAVQRMNADYIVRITADCPLIPPFLITKHIKTAIMNNYDYVSNTYSDTRTSVDGNDCEVLSRRMIEYLDKHVTDPYDREHVTTAVKTNPPDWARTGQVINHLDLAHMKLSVDSPEDLERVRAQYARIQQCYDQAVELHGRGNVHRF